MKQLKTNFRLEKHYLDCIDKNGNCFIIYQAYFKYYFIRIVYSGLVFSDLRGKTIEKSSLRKRVGGSSLEFFPEFENTMLGISGTLKIKDQPIPSFTYKDFQNHELIWDCHHPKLSSEINYNNYTYKGLGYGETLYLTIKPWNLPLTELKWGRFLSESYTISWINWKGNHPVNKIFFNGEEYDDAAFESDRIIFGAENYCITFGDMVIIRKGTLANLLSKMPWLRIILPGSILKLSEVKYKAKSTLCINSEMKATGWSLFEYVLWKN